MRGLRLLLNHVFILHQARFEFRDGAFDRQAAACPEKVDRREVGKPLAQPAELATRLGRIHLWLIELCHERSRVPGDLVVVGVARRIEQRPHLVVRKAVDQTRLADDGFATALDDLFQEPREVLLRLGGRRQRVDGALDRDCPDALQPPPDLHPEVGRLGRDLMNQKKPLRCGLARNYVIFHIDTVSLGPYNATSVSIRLTN